MPFIAWLVVKNAELRKLDSHSNLFLVFRIVIIANVILTISLFTIAFVFNPKDLDDIIFTPWIYLFLAAICLF
ncbi:MAG: hypothetical protein ACTSQK_12360, partial [Candidatus Heimdallarchaeota archaeon]